MPDSTGSDESLTDTFLADPNNRSACAFVLGAVALLSLRYFLLSCDFLYHWDQRVSLPLRKYLYKGKAKEPVENFGQVQDVSRVLVSRKTQQVLQFNTLFLSAYSSSSPPRPKVDPFRLVTILNAITFIWASVSAIKLSSTFSSNQGQLCTAIGVWVTLSFQSSRVIAFAVVALDLTIPEMKATTIEFYTVGVILVARLVASVVTVVIRLSTLSTLSDPFQQVSICQLHVVNRERNETVAMAFQLQDCLMLVAIATRFMWSSMKEDKRSPSYISPWNSLLRCLFTRRMLRLFTISFSIISALTGESGLLPLTQYWVPLGVSAILMLIAYNRPLDPGPSASPCTLPVMVQPNGISPQGDEPATTDQTEKAPANYYGLP